MRIAQITSDARYFQIAFQLMLLSYGLFFLQWQAAWPLYCTYLGISVVAQAIFEFYLGKKYIPFSSRIKFVLPSAIISSLGLCLLLKTNSLPVAAFAAIVSIASKYLIKANGKHIFNPSALGIVAAIFLTGKAWFSPGQWGSGAVIMFGVAALGFIVVSKVQKLDTSLAFLGTFGGLLFARQIVYLGWPIDYFVQSISTGSLLLFSFFMITDPKTIPNHRRARVLFSIIVAAAAFYLTAFKFVNGAPIYMLVLLQPLVPLLDRIFKKEAYQWMSVRTATTP